MTTFATALSDDFHELLDQPNFRHEARNPEGKDFEDCVLCFVAAEDDTLGGRSRAGGERRLAAWVNVADRPRFCDFIMPSILDRSPLVVAISTGGASPILGRMLKARLGKARSPPLTAALQTSWAGSATRWPRRSPLRSSGDDFGDGA